MMSQHKMMVKAVLLVVVILQVATVASAAVVTTGGIYGYPTDNSHWFIGETIAGEPDGTGTLTIDDGSYLLHSDGTRVTYVANNTGTSGSTITVTGSGSQFDHSGSVYAGWADSAALVVENGGILNTNYGSTTTYTTLGYNAGASGTATVSGAGSVWTDSSGTFRLALLGNASLTVSDSGRFVANYNAWMASGSGSQADATVTGADSAWIIGQKLSIASADAATTTLTIENAGVVKAKDIECMSDAAVIRMQTGGMLALEGVATNLSEFTALFTGTYDSGDIQYYNGNAWDAIENATAGVDYLVAEGIGDLAGYTVLSARPISCQQMKDLGYKLDADLNYDCYVEWADFGIFASQWQECYDPADPSCDLL